jgi:uncharacterized membrane protein
LKDYALKPLRWLEVIFAFTAVTLLVTFLTPNGSDLLVMAPRFALTFIFVAFLPGYCIVNILFIGKNSIDLPETLVLSVALSFGIAGLDGLFLGLSPIGIFPVPIAASLCIIVLALAAVAFIRQRSLALHQVQVPQQVSA